MTENAHLQSRVQAKGTELATAQQQLRRNVSLKDDLVAQSSVVCFLIAGRTFASN